VYSARSYFFDIRRTVKIPSAMANIMPTAAISG